MPNILTYLDWRGDIPLSVAPFNPADNLILCVLSYADFSASVGREGRATVAEAARAARTKSEEERAFCRAIGQSARFGSAILTDYVNEIDTVAEKQFSAVTARLSDGSAFVAYRGTDDTLVGWKEDFNLAFEDSVPAQREAVAYLNRVARTCACPIRVGGHSKGGNLAVYAASYCEDDVQSRVLNIYSNDGPGQTKRTIESDGYARIRPRLRVFVPQSSIVGMLLEHDRDYTIVKSDARGGILQHDPMTWQTRPTGFETVRRVTADSVYLSGTIDEWLRAMSRDERRAFAEALYKLLGASNASTLSELSENWQKTVPAILTAAIGSERDSTKMLVGAARDFLAVAAREAREIAKTERIAVDTNGGQPL